MNKFLLTTLANLENVRQTSVSQVVHILLNVPTGVA
jgi:hypothetical protein